MQKNNWLKFQILLIKYYYIVQIWNIEIFLKVKNQIFKLLYILKECYIMNNNFNIWNQDYNKKRFYIEIHNIKNYNKNKIL